MADCRNSLRIGIILPFIAIILLSTIHSSKSASNDYRMDVSRIAPASISENTLRHFMQLFSLGTGLRVPPPLNMRYREKSYKRARLSPPSRSYPDFVIGSEFLGKRASADKRMGSEFLGKRMGSEFLGKRMGSEFLGKRMGSEFLGKRMGSEFLGKRVGSEFLGKRMGSEFLGKRSDESDIDSSGEQSDETRIGSELVGKRSDGLRTGGDMQTPTSMEGQDSLGSPSIVFFENSKRMGSEFLGRKRRDTRTSDLRIPGG